MVANIKSKHQVDKEVYDHTSSLYSFTTFLLHQEIFSLNWGFPSLTTPTFCFLKALWCLFFRGVWSVTGWIFTCSLWYLSFKPTTLCSSHLPLFFSHLTCCVLEYKWCVCVLETAPTSSYHNTSGQWAAVTVAMLKRRWGTSTDRSCGHLAECFFGSGVVFLSSVTAGLVTQEAVKLEVCRTFCLSDDSGVNSVLNCRKTNLICVKTGAYASGYRIPHLSILCCCFWLVQCSVY